MTHSAPFWQWMAQRAAVVGAVLAALGVVAAVLGRALFYSRVLGFLIETQIDVVAGVVGLGMVSCRMLLRAAQSVVWADLTAAGSGSLAGGKVALLVLLLAAAVALLVSPLLLRLARRPTEQVARRHET